MKTDVIVVDYKADDLVARLESDLWRFSAYPYELHLWNNEGVQKNLSMVRNDLASQGDGECLLFANPDICIGPEWDRRLSRRLLEVPAGVVCPKELPRDTPPTEEEMEDAQKTVEFDGRLTRLDGYEKFSRLAAVFMSREMWRRLKGYDERFRFAGGDRELCQRVEILESKTYLVHSCVFYHYGNYSRKKVAEDPSFDGEAETKIKFDLLEQLKAGTIKRWHLLDDKDRKEVRATSFYQTIGARA